MNSGLFGRCIAGAAFGLVALATQAGAAVISTGTYQLHNHPDGNANPPAYGLRLDELFNATGDHDIFTFDFDHASSNMRLDYNGSTIRIYGQTFGGRDTGSGYANDVYRGIYGVDFTYTLGVTPNLGGDDDLGVVPPSMRNFGTITAPVVVGSGPIALADKDADGYTFRFGDENNDLGHRGFAGISGWGWLIHHFPNAPHVDSSDWLFTATLIPAPGAVSMIGLGLLAAGRRRR